MLFVQLTLTRGNKAYINCCITLLCNRMFSMRNKVYPITPSTGDKRQLVSDGKYVRTLSDAGSLSGVRLSNSLKDTVCENVFNATKFMCDLSYAKAYLYNMQHYGNSNINTIRSNTSCNSSISDTNGISTISAISSDKYRCNSSNDKKSDSKRMKRQIKSAKFVEQLKADESEIMNQLSELSFISCKTLYGRTGSNNQREDATCVISCSEDESVIIVAFHGTVTINMKEVFRLKSDWGSNYRFAKMSAIKKFPTEVSGIPDFVRFHGGYFRNYHSVHDELLAELKLLASQRLNNGENGAIQRQKWIIFTGHSKGAGMATIAAGIIKSHVTQCNEMSDVNIGVIAFSSPKVVNGSRTESWLYDILGCRNNIIRIIVDNDIALNYPPKILGYRAVGCVHEEELSSVVRRLTVRQDPALISGSLVTSNRSPGVVPGSQATGNRDAGALPGSLASSNDSYKKLSLLLRKNLEHYTISKSGYLMFGPHLAPSFAELCIR